jgi:hypothetical protein
MKRAVRRRWIGLLSLVLIAVVGVVTALVVFAGTSNDEFTATAYADVIRFEAAGVATLQVTIYDLSGKKVWDSGMVSGSSVDWDRNNERGERMAYGAYLYVAQGWEAGGELSFKKNGKLALMPGDKVQLQQAPVVRSTTDTSSQASTTDEEPHYAPKSYSYGNLSISGNLGIGVDPGVFPIDIRKSVGYGSLGFQMIEQNAPITWRFEVIGNAVPGRAGNFEITEMGVANHFVIAPGGNVGIGTTSPSAKLEIEATSGDLIAAYNSSNRVFVVKSTGEVRADGTVYAAGFNTGSADVAERINVSEWVEAGNVVEIDTDHPGFFRKSTAAYSTKVAGIISTSPGVILGNNFDEEKDDWEDNRPVLAVTGRVPCMVSTENGPISIGDLLVASSTPGVAMKGNSEQATGAVVGKAMEPLEQGEGTIVVQVMLR